MGELVTADEARTLRAQTANPQVESLALTVEVQAWRIAELEAWLEAAGRWTVTYDWDASRWMGGDQ